MTVETAGASLAGLFIGIIFGWAGCEIWKVEQSRKQYQKYLERQELIDAIYDKLREGLKKP